MVGWLLLLKEDGVTILLKNKQEIADGLDIVINVD